MKYYLLFILIFLQFNYSSFAQEVNWEQVAIEIENIIKPQYGDQYLVGVEFADSLLGRFAEGGFYKFNDPNNLLQGCTLFSAEDTSGSLGSIFGIFKNGNILWHTDPIIKGKWMSVPLIRDINNDSKINVITNWYVPETEYVWIFSWDGTTGTIINDYDRDSTSRDYGCSKIQCNFNSLEIFDYENDGVLDLRCGQDTTEVTFSWNGNQYGNWTSTPEVPLDYIFPANRLTVKCNAQVKRNGDMFDYSYKWSNDANSEQSIYEITLYNTSCDEELDSPKQWLVNSEKNLTPLTSWMTIYSQQMIYPGAERDSFNILCNKIPKVVDFYVKGNTIPPSFSSYEEVMNDLILNSYHGFTIGPQMNNDIGYFDFLDSLINYNNQSYDLGWIKDEPTYNKYNTYLTNAKNYLVQRDSSLARTELQKVLTDCVIDSSTVLTSEAFALLYYNTEFLISKLPETQTYPYLKVNFRDSEGNFILNGSLQYYNFGWKDVVNNGDGTFNVEIQKEKVSLRMNYERASQQLDNVTVAKNTVTFSTVKTIVKLLNSQNEMINDYSVQYYASGWKEFDTATNGEAVKELLPRAYSFRMNYEGASQQLDNVTITQSPIIFQTVNCIVRVSDGNGQPINNAATSYYAS